MRSEQTLPSDWECRRLNEVAAVIDCLHKTPTYAANGFPMVRVTDVKGGFLDLRGALLVAEDVYEDFTRREKPQRGDIVFSRVGTYGVSSFVNTSTPFCLGQNTALIRPRINSRYVYHCLQSPEVKHQIEQTVVGSTQKTISLKSINSLRLPLPKARELEAIAHILGTLDDKIELNRRMNETLEAMARALFKSWFVDFDPVRAKMEGRQPEGMDKATADLFPASFQDSPLGKIPRGWRACPLPDAVEVNPPRSLRKNEIAPYLDMNNMPTQGHRPARWILRPMASGTKFTNGDTLLARITPCLENGKTAYVDFLDDGQVGWGSTEYIVLRPKAPLPTQYGYFLARSDELTTTPAQIDRWRQASSEHERLEFKEAKTQFDNRRLCEYCVALANEGGGHLLLGVADRPPRSVVGTQAFDNPVAMAEKLFQAVGFRVDIEEVAHPDGRVLVFHIPSRPRGSAYHLEGKYLMFAGASLVPMSEDQLRRIFAEGEPDWLEEYTKSGLDAQEVIELLTLRPSLNCCVCRTPSASTTSSERSRTRRRCRSTTKAGLPSWP
jgi:type I restriction enzyme S subunit